MTKIKFYIATDEDGSVYAYAQEPTAKINGSWAVPSNSSYAQINMEDSDTEPQEIELEIKDEE